MNPLAGLLVATGAWCATAIKSCRNEQGDLRVWTYFSRKREGVSNAKACPYTRAIIAHGSTPPDLDLWSGGTSPGNDDSWRQGRKQARQHAGCSAGV